MDLRDYYNILFLLIGTFSLSFSQVSDVKCINPEFDILVDNYLDYTVPPISVADAHESKEQFIFLDAREIEEYNISHIENSIHIGYDKFNIEKLDPTLSKDTPIIIYCSIGYRSEKIGEVLKNNGFQIVYNLYGSIFEWVNQHHPIYDLDGNQISKLHTYNKKWSKWVDDDIVEKVWGK